MIRLAPVIGALAAATGCVGLTAHGGVEATPAGRFGGIAEAQVGSDFGGGSVGYLATARGGPGYGDAGVGMQICKRTYGWTSPQFCGQVIALELGAFEGHFALGAASPSLSIGLWKPTRPRPKPANPNDATSIRPTEAFTAQLELGLHVRPLRKFEGTAPYLAITFGGGIGASWY